MSNRRKLRGGPVPGPAPHLVPPPGVRTEAFVPVDLRESATATIERVQVDEASTTAKIRSTGARRYRARLIEGNRWGSSGYYPRKVLERDGPTAWPAGTLMYLDHPTPTEEAERPERSVRDLAARTTTAPVYEGDGLYADIEVFAHAAPLVEALAATIGLSVRGEGTATFGEVAGRQGMIIESLDRGYSVDFVTRAGAGGALVSLLESARAAGVRVREDRNVGAWIESRLHLGLTQLGDNMYGNGYLSRDERITLSSAVGDALQAFTARVEADAPQLFQRDLYDGPPDADDPAGATAVSEASSEDIRRVLDDLLHDAYPTGQNGYLWVRDYDADRHLVWFDVNPDDDGDCGTYEQSYAIGDNGQLSLTGTRTEVVARTVYSPVTPDTEDVAEAHRPPATAPAPTPAAPPASTSTTSTTPSTSGGAPPTEPIPRKESTVDPTNTGPAPGAAGAAGGGQATPVTEADPGSGADRGPHRSGPRHRRTRPGHQRGPAAARRRHRPHHHRPHGRRGRQRPGHDAGAHRAARRRPGRRPGPADRGRRRQHRGPHRGGHLRDRGRVHLRRVDPRSRRRRPRRRARRFAATRRAVRGRLREGHGQGTAGVRHAGRSGAARREGTLTMAKNEVYEEGTHLAVACSDPATPASGDPVVSGQRPGVCLVAEDAAGLASVTFEGVFNLSVKGVTTAGAGSAVAEGDILYYVAANTPKVSKASGDAGAVRFGYAAGAVNSAATATIPVILGY
jgi:predicted RecA/RadA family phage recombinase